MSLLLERSTIFYYNMWLCDSNIYVILSHIIWEFVIVICDITLNLNPSSWNKKIKQKKVKIRNKIKSDIHNSNTTNFHWYNTINTLLTRE